MIAADYPRVAHATSYCQSGTMADGTQTRTHSIAMNSLPMGTHIRLSHPVFGMVRFVVRDRIGWGSELDVFTSSCKAAVTFGRRTLHYKIGW